MDTLIPYGFAEFSINLTVGRSTKYLYLCPTHLVGWKLPDRQAVLRRVETYCYWHLIPHYNASLQYIPKYIIKRDRMKAKQQFILPQQEHIEEPGQEEALSLYCALDASVWTQQNAKSRLDWIVYINGKSIKNTDAVIVRAMYKRIDQEMKPVLRALGIR